jgi:methylenetetrahydrofolate reductase (NADPH)
MSLGTSTAAEPDGVETLLSGARFELMPFESFTDEITHLPDGATIAITTSPQLGIDTTVERTEQAAADGYEVVPHVAARYVESRDHLDEIAGRLEDAGITDVFVPGGDREEPAGEFESAYQLLVALDELGYEFEEVGITGYPEGHHFLDDETLAESMAKKEPYATYITTQLCYDSDAVIEWTDEVRDRGVDLPVEVGIPGVMKYQRLLQISKKVGVGESIQFLKKTSGLLGFVRQIVGSRGMYKPDSLVDGLASYVDDAHYDIRGVHIYTMNQTEDLESWRRARLGE